MLTFDNGGVREREAASDPLGWFAAGVLAICVVGAATAIAIAFGAFSLPRGDDWAYRKTAIDFSRTHHFHLAGWNDVTLLGQVLAAQPVLKLVANSNLALSIYGIVAALAAAVLTYAVARTLLARADALLVLVAVLLFPSFALNSTSFMTDATAFASELACLLLGMKSLKSKSFLPSLAAALVIGFFGFTVREFALAAPVAVIAAHGLKRFPLKRGVLVSGLAFAAGAVAFYLWRRSLQPPVHQPSLQAPGSAVAALAQALYALGLGALPATALVASSIRPRGRKLYIGLLSAAIAAVLGVALASQSHVLLGSTVTRTGASWEGLLLGRQPDLFSRAVWGMIVLATVGAGSVLAYVSTAIAMRRAVPKWWADSRTRLLLLFGFAQAVALVGRAASGGGILDRYLWPVLVVVIVLFLRCAPGQRSRVVAYLPTGPIVLLLLLSLVTLVDSYGFAAARWHLGERAVKAGAAPRDVDAGFEWVGYNYPGVANEQGLRVRSTEPRSPYLTRLFPRSRNCFVVASEPIQARMVRQIGTIDYKPFGVFGRRRLRLYANGVACP